MRTVMFATLAVCAALLANAAPASASGWTCVGPAYACDAQKPSVTASKPSNKPSRHTAHTGTTKHAKKVIATSRDDDETPVRRSRKTQRRHVANTDSGGSSFSGKASYYWEPQRTASGGWFNPHALTAAHKTLPFGTKVRVTNRNNGQSVVVTINDRGPYVAGRVIDLSSAAAGAINMKGSGVVPVSVAVLGR